MNSIDILNAIGDVDDEYVVKAKAKRTSYKKVWITLGSSLAACLALFIAVPVIFAMTMRASSPGPGAASHHGEYVQIGVETSPTYDDAKIFYVADGKICSKTMYICFSPENAFTAWREANGIGDEVKFIKCKIESNSTTTERVMSNGEKVMEHFVGDYFILNVTISKNIENYYDRIDSELLLESLERTMKDYDEDYAYSSDLEYDEYHLILEPVAEASMPPEFMGAEHEPAYVYDDAKIFYVADGKICSKTQPMYYKPEDIFAAWREANGIGKEVDFVKCEIEDNSTDTEKEIGGETFIEHTIGNYFILNVTISKRIEDYYDRIDSDLLLESLERTMKDYDEDNILGGGIEYDEYHLILV